MKKIVFAMIEAGGGHKAPAQAVHESLIVKYPGRYKTAILDFMKDLGCKKLDHDHKRSWDFLLRHPMLASIGFYLENLFAVASRRLIRRYLRPFYPYVERYLKETRPAVVFSTHYFNSFAIGRVIRENNLPVKLVTFVSEIFDVHAFWIIENVDHYIVTSGYAKRLLMHDGIRENSIRVVPYPIRNSFFNITRTREEILLAERINPRKKTLLISFGGQGIGKIHHYLDILIRKKIDINVIVVTGKNTRSFVRLKSRYDAQDPVTSVHVKGFVTRMNEFFFACDFCFIKSGPATTMEAVLLKKPIIFYKPASGNEKTNIVYFMKKKIALYAGKSALLFLDAVRKLLDPVFYKGMQEEFCAMRFANGSDEIAEFLHELAEGDPAPVNRMSPERRENRR